MQWDFAGRLGPAPGRYVVRRFAGDAVRQIVVVAELGAEPTPRRRRARATGGAEPPAVGVTRVTVIEGEALGDARAAAAWLERSGRAEAEQVVAEARAVLARAVAAHRVAAADPHVADPDPGRALATRIGYGTGDQVAEGEWEQARVLPAGSGRRRRADLRPQQRLAALLAGHDAALACEELALRARADVAAGRPREAAMQLEAALGAALAELAGWRSRADLDRRLEELAGHRDAVAAAAAAARAGTLGPDDVAAVETALQRLEAALRARAAVAGG